MLTNSSVAYQGDLVVLAVPNGAVFSLTISDTPNPGFIAFRPPPAVDMRTEVVECNLRRHRQAEESRIRFLAAPRRPYALRWIRWNRVGRRGSRRSNPSEWSVPVYESGSQRKPTGSVPDPTSAINLRRGGLHEPSPPRGKGKALVEFLRRCAEQEEAVRKLLKPDPALLREWWSTGRLAF
jgi:hypothetical protein